MQQCKSCQTIYITDSRNCLICNEVEGDYTDIFRVQSDTIFEPLEISKIVGTYKSCDNCQMYIKHAFGDCPRCGKVMRDYTINGDADEGSIDEGVISTTVGLVLYDILKFLIKLPFQVVKSFLAKWEEIKKKRSDFVKLIFKGDIELEAIGLNIIIISGAIASLDGVSDNDSKELLDLVNKINRSIKSSSDEYDPQKASMTTINNIKEIRIDWVELARKIKPFEYPELDKTYITKFIREVVKLNK